MSLPKAAPAPAPGSLDDDRKTYAAGDLQTFLRVVRERPVGAGQAGNAGLFHGLDGGYLVAHGADGFRLRPDKHKPALDHLLGEIRIFGEKTVAGMNRLGVGDFRGADDCRHVQVAFPGSGGADAHGFVRQPDMLEVAVRLGMNGDGLDPKFTTGP